jgi:entericidin B
MLEFAGFHSDGRAPCAFLKRSEKMKKSLQAVVLVLTASLALSACNTVKGAGKDVQSAGKAVEKTGK